MRGGKRPGAGRPRSTPGSLRISVRITPTAAIALRNLLADGTPINTAVSDALVNLDKTSNPKHPERAKNHYGLVITKNTCVFAKRATANGLKELLNGPNSLLSMKISHLEVPEVAHETWENQDDDQ